MTCADPEIVFKGWRRIIIFDNLPMWITPTPFRAAHVSHASHNNKWINIYIFTYFITTGSTALVTLNFHLFFIYPLPHTCACTTCNRINTRIQYTQNSKNNMNRWTRRIRLYIISKRICKGLSILINSESIYCADTVVEI